MIYLDQPNDAGSMLYLDIHRVAIERVGDEQTVIIGAVLGDGRYEGEVQIETGSQCGVTFHDEWLDPRAIEELWAMTDRDQLVRSLAALATKLKGDLLSLEGMDAPRLRVDGAGLEPGGYGEAFPSQPRVHSATAGYLAA